MRQLATLFLVSLFCFTTSATGQYLRVSQGNNPSQHYVGLDNEGNDTGDIESYNEATEQWEKTGEWERVEQFDHTDIQLKDENGNDTCETLERWGGESGFTECNGVRDPNKDWTNHDFSEPCTFGCNEEA